jgi:cytoskeletal protein RodZ
VTEAEDISVGNRLATARKKKRLRYKKISSELNIEESYLIALEEENYDRIPGGEAYVKGFLRSYAKKLNLDPDEIISQYLLTRLQSKEGNSVKQIEKGIEEFSIRKNILFLFTALLILSIFMFFLKDEADSTEIISKTYSSEVNEEINLNNEVIQETQNIENNSILYNEENSTFKNLKPDNQPKDQINNNKIPVSGNIIDIFVYDDCWIEVFSENERLLYRLSQSGETYTFTEKKIKIIAGNYKNLRVSFNDKIVDLGINANANQVSCVVLPLGDCSEFRTTNN